MIKTGIYAILNFVSNKIYIGQAFNIQKRWKNHRIGLRLNQHTNRYLQAAHNKDGRFAFIYYVLEECELGKLTEREQYWMDFYKSSNREFGYNLAPAADSNFGLKHLPETIEAWSKQRKGKIRGPEARAAIKAGWVKRKENGPVSEETRKKQSESHKGKIPTKEDLAKRSISLMGNSNSKGYIRSEKHLKALADGRRKARHKNFIVDMM